MRRKGQRLQTGLKMLASIMTICLIMTAGIVEGGVAGASSPTWQVDVSYPSSQIGLLSGVACPSATDCYAVGNTHILATTNGGATWSPQTIPSDVNTLSDISCVSASSCVAVGGSQTYPMVVTTTNSGATWTYESAPSEDIGLTDVTCPPGGSNCMAVATFNREAGGDGLIESTNDGVTWTQGSLPSGFSPPEDAFCSTDSICVLVGEGATVPEAAFTTDFGSSWTVSTLPSGLKSLFAVTCTSTMNCIGVGTNSENGPAVVLTANGGSTWSSVSGEPTVSVSQVSCLSSSDCTAVGSSGVITGSTDGGEAWTNQTPPAMVTVLSGLSCIAPSGCVAVGAEGTYPNYGGTVIQDFSPQLTVTTTSLPAATPGAPYSQTLAATNGTPPYTWKLEKGSHLPKGLKLDKKTGAIAGTPSTKAKSETFTVEVVDAAKDTATATLSIAVT